MKKILTTTLLLLSLTAAIAQAPADIAGHWQFKEIVAPDGADEEAIAKLTGYFKETSFDFNENGLYLAALMGRPDNGTWKLHPGKIELSSDKGEVYSLDIVEHKKDHLNVKIRSAAFTMTRVSGSQLKSATAVPAKTNTYVTATKEQLCKKWFLKEIVSDRDMTEDLRKFIEDAVKGSAIEFFKNGSYNLKAMGIEEDGKWKFGDNKKAIVTESGESKQFWNVIEITAEKLVVVRGNSEDKFIYSSKE